MNQATRTRTRRIEKPGGVYLITAYDFIAMGLIPFISMIFALSLPNQGYGVVEVFVSLVLCLAVMGASVWALNGDNFGRQFLLAVVSITAGIWIIGALAILTGSLTTDFGRPRVIGYIVRGVTALILNWWYFHRQNVREYYRQ